jgi:polysaccharide export outer membrane protein
MLRRLCSVLTIVGWALAGCAANPPPAPQQASAAAPTGGGYQLGPGDEIDVTVFGEQNLSGTFDVDDSGSISMPLVGPVSVRDKTARETETAIASRLSDGLVTDPKVSVNVRRFRPIYVVGEVQKPGAYPSYGPTTVLNAIALAGGYTYRAKSSEITVIHYNDPSHQPVPVSESSLVQPGDTVTVPERWF